MLKGQEMVELLHVEGSRNGSIVAIAATKVISSSVFCCGLGQLL